MIKKKKKSKKKKRKSLKSTTKTRFNLISYDVLDFSRVTCRKTFAKKLLSYVSPSTDSGCLWHGVPLR